MLWRIIFVRLQNYGDVAQLARALDWQSRGRRFEPDLLHIENQALTSDDVGAFFIICIQFAYKIAPKRSKATLNSGEYPPFVRPEFNGCLGSIVSQGLCWKRTIPITHGFRELECFLPQAVLEGGFEDFEPKKAL